ncbi:MAG: riboflavin synthase [Desulfobacterales bacterium]|nr:MAG: riboflavin synthase [Desulfobacterales bacterium]
MFTGIIEGLGTIKETQPAGQGKQLILEADFVLDDSKVGESIAVNGACLTVVSLANRRFHVDVSPESLIKTTLGKAKIGDRVNLERALRLSDRIGGHLVSGHVDGLGMIKQKKRMGNAIILSVHVPESITRYMITKGSVAVDGISLTINHFSRDRFEVSIIPHTAKMTTIDLSKIGDLVNIETDMIGKYVERFILKISSTKKEDETGNAVDMQLLAKSGFI